MERLTKKSTTGPNRYVSAIGSGHGAWPRIIQRLAAYENTGLEPEEIAGKWIPVTERLPGFEIERVLVMTKGDCILGYPKMDTDRYVNGRWVRYSDNVTHWMPLPEQPEEG